MMVGQMSKTSPNVKIISISDLHLNHPKVSTREMVNRLILWLKSIKDIRSFQYLIISGDVYDRPTQVDTEAGKQITRFISFILDFCAKYGIRPIILKGTGSHDGDQSAHFLAMDQGREVSTGLIYADKIDVWTDENDVSFLFVPDEATPSAAQTKSEIEALMKERNISKVDVAVTHGLYNSHVLNGIIDHHAHDAEWYSSIVNYMVINGHIHTTSSYDRIHTVGSFDRTKHGEEEAKGGWLFELDKEQMRPKKWFVENELAEKFVTYMVQADNAKDAFREVKKFIIKDNIKLGGHLRLAHKPELDINELLKRLASDYAPDIEFTSKKLDGKTNKESLNEKVEEFQTINIVPITDNTVMELFADKLTRMEIEDQDRYLEMFKKVANIK